VLTISSLPTDLAAFAHDVETFLAGRRPGVTPTPESATTTCVGGGTDESQRTVQAERVLGLRRQPRQVSRPPQ
jgi:hypothetical protein